jgi:hypothetical protein
LWVAQGEVQDGEKYLDKGIARGGLSCQMNGIGRILRREGGGRGGGGKVIVGLLRLHYNMNTKE